MNTAWIGVEIFLHHCFNAVSGRISRPQIASSSRLISFNRAFASWREIFLH